MKIRSWILFALLIMSATVWQAIPAEAAVAKNGFHSTKGSWQGGENGGEFRIHGIRWAHNKGFERIVIDLFQEPRNGKGAPKPAAVPCRFRVNYEYYPFRFTVVLSGVRGEKNRSWPSFGKSGFLGEIYPVPEYSGGRSELALELKKPVEYKVLELHRPGRIVIDIRPLNQPLKPPAVYSVRTKPIGSDTAGKIGKALTGRGRKNVRLIKIANGHYLVEDAYYPTRAAAEWRLKQIIGEIKDVSFFVERREAAQIPK